MTLIALGINHKTAPLSVREQVSFTEDRLVDGLKGLQQQLGLSESVILSTCNRTELYIWADKPQLSSNVLMAWMAEFHRLEPSALSENIYVHHQQQAVQHLMRVAAGLDSMIIGEPQILGQVKQAFTSAKDTGMVKSHFDKLFQETFSVAKKVRSETEIGSNAISVAYASVQLAKHIFSSLKHTRVLLIGAGETISLVAKHMKEQQVKAISVANRTLARAEQLAQQVGATTLTLGQIPEQLAQADIVISSTGSQLPIIGKGLIEKALKERRHQPMFLVDLAVPRDIESEVEELADAYLYTVDDLQNIVQQNLSNREEAAAIAEQMINQQATHYMDWLASLSSLNLVLEYRQQSEQLRDRLTHRAHNQIKEGQDPQQVLDELANKLTNSLIHPTTQALKLAATQSDGKLINLLGQAYNLLAQDKE
jgi:glutamyl-tRNA reductase